MKTPTKSKLFQNKELSSFRKKLYKKLLVRRKIVKNGKLWLLNVRERQILNEL